MRLIFEAFTEDRDITIGDAEIIQGLLFSGRFASTAPLGVIRLSGHWGRFLIAHAYIDEDPPAAMQPHTENRVENMPLPMPSGKLLICGYEVFPSAWREEAQEIPRGLYRVEGFGVKPTWRDEAQSAEEREWSLQYARNRSLPSMAFFFGLFAAMSGIGWSAIYLYRTPLGWLFAVSAFLFALSLLRLFSPEYKQIVSRAQKADREFPAVVLLLKREPDPSPPLKPIAGVDSTPALPHSESNP